MVLFNRGKKKKKTPPNRRCLTAVKQAARQITAWVRTRDFSLSVPSSPFLRGSRRRDSSLGSDSVIFCTRQSPGFRSLLPGSAAFGSIHGSGITLLAAGRDTRWGELVLSASRTIWGCFQTQILAVGYPTVLPGRAPGRSWGCPVAGTYMYLHLF